MDSGGLVYTLNHTQRRRELEQNGSKLAQDSLFFGPSLPLGLGVAESLEVVVLSDTVQQKQTILKYASTFGAKIAHWLVRDAIQFSDIKPSPKMHYDVVSALESHFKLVKLRNKLKLSRSKHLESSSTNSEDAMNDPISKIATSVASSSFHKTNKSIGLQQPKDYPLALSIAIGIKLFFKLLRSLQRAGHIHGLLRLSSSLQPLLDRMHPLALSEPSKSFQIRYHAERFEYFTHLVPSTNATSLSTSHQASFHGEHQMIPKGNKGYYHENLENSAKIDQVNFEDDVDTQSGAVVDAVWEAVLELAALDPVMLGCHQHSQTLSALVSLAVKRGELKPLLESCRLLLFGSKSDKKVGEHSPQHERSAQKHEEEEMRSKTSSHQPHKLFSG